MFATSDAISGDLDVAALRFEASDAAIESMEGAGAALACHHLDLPFAELRGVSNIAGVRDKSQWQVDAALKAMSRALVTALQIGQTHVAALPPLGMVQAVDVAGAEIILQSVRFGSPTYHTQFFTNEPAKYCADEPVVNERREAGEMLPFLNCNGTDRSFDEARVGPIGLDALQAVEQGTTVAFTRAGSSSGYIFPATVFATEGIDPRTDLYAVFTDEHDRSVATVCSGEAEIGVSYDDARPDTITDCDVSESVVVFAYGPEIPNDGIAVSGDLSDDLRDRVKQALLDYAATDEGAAVLDTIYNINAFADPDLGSLQIIRDAVETLGYGQ